MSETPAPVESPKHPEPPRHDTGEVPVTKGEMKKALTRNEIWTFIVAVATAAAALLGGYTLFIDKAEAAGRKEAAEARKEAHAALEQGNDLKQDMRDLYKAVMYGKKSERLEAPPTARDGGP